MVETRVADVIWLGFDVMLLLTELTDSIWLGFGHSMCVCCHLTHVLVSLDTSLISLDTSLISLDTNLMSLDTSLILLDSRGWYFWCVLMFV